MTTYRQKLFPGWGNADFAEFSAFPVRIVRATNPKRSKSKWQKNTKSSRSDRVTTGCLRQREDEPAGAYMGAGMESAPCEQEGTLQPTIAMQEIRNNMPAESVYLLEKSALSAIFCCGFGGAIC